MSNLTREAIWHQISFFPMKKKLAFSCSFWLSFKMLDFTAMGFHSKFICINIGGKKRKMQKRVPTEKNLVHIYWADSQTCLQYLTLRLPNIIKEKVLFRCSNFLLSFDTIIHLNSQTPFSAKSAKVCYINKLFLTRWRFIHLYVLSEIQSSLTRADYFIFFQPFKRFWTTILFSLPNLVFKKTIPNFV